jgi:hypothetical protein
MRFTLIVVLYLANVPLLAYGHGVYYHPYVYWPRPFYGYPSLYYPYFSFDEDRGKRKTQRPAYRQAHPFGYYYILQEKPPRQP